MVLPSVPGRQKLVEPMFGSFHETAAGNLPF